MNKTAFDRKLKFAMKKAMFEVRKIYSVKSFRLSCRTFIEENLQNYATVYLCASGNRCFGQEISTNFGISISAYANKSDLFKGVLYHYIITIIKELIIHSDRLCERMTSSFELYSLEKNLESSLLPFICRQRWDSVLN